MTAAPEREPDAALYHGTRRGFRRGGLLLPRATHGGPGTSAPLNRGRKQPADAGEWVYLTTDLDLAWVYAFHAPGRGAAKVLVVRSLDSLIPDPEHSGAMSAWRCKAATIAKVLTEPTITEDEARSGWVMDAAESRPRTRP